MEKVGTMILNFFFLTFMELIVIFKMHNQFHVTKAATFTN